MMSNEPLVSIIVINYNGQHHLKRCLDSLKHQTYSDFEVILVDNNSADGSVEYINKNYSDFVKIIANSENYGFAKGNNIGIQNACGKYIVTLNNDTVVEPHWLEELIKAAAADGTIGMCASKIYFMNEDNLIDSSGIAIYPDGTSKQRGWRQKDEGQYAKQEEVLLPSGCAALYRRKMLDEIGLFDEDFFAYCEDTDLGLRGRLMGWKCVFVPSAIVYHFYSGYWQDHFLRKAFFIERNRLLMVFKLFPVWMIFLSSYHYLIRIIYSFYGIMMARGTLQEYVSDISIFKVALVIIRAHWEAIKLLPSMWAKRKKIKEQMPLRTQKIKQLFKKFAVPAREVALR